MERPRSAVRGAPIAPMLISTELERGAMVGAGQYGIPKRSATGADAVPLPAPLLVPQPAGAPPSAPSPLPAPTPGPPSITAADLRAMVRALDESHEGLDVSAASPLGARILVSTTGAPPAAAGTPPRGPNCLEAIYSPKVSPGAEPPPVLSTSIRSPRSSPGRQRSGRAGLGSPTHVRAGAAAALGSGWGADGTGEGAGWSAARPRSPLQAAYGPPPPPPPDPPELTWSARPLTPLLAAYAPPSPPRASAPAPAPESDPSLSSLPVPAVQGEPEGGAAASAAGNGSGDQAGRQQAGQGDGGSSNAAAEPRTTSAAWDSSPVGASPGGRSQPPQPMAAWASKAPGSPGTPAGPGPAGSRVSPVGPGRTSSSRLGQAQGPGPRGPGPGSRPGADGGGSGSGGGGGGGRSRREELFEEEDPVVVLEQSIALLSEIEGLMRSSAVLPPDQPLDGISREVALRIPGELLEAMEDTLEVIAMAREEIARGRGAAKRPPPPSGSAVAPAPGGCGCSHEGPGQRVPGGGSGAGRRLSRSGSGSGSSFGIMPSHGPLSSGTGTGIGTRRTSRGSWAGAGAGAGHGGGYGGYRGVGSHGPYPQHLPPINSSSSVGSRGSPSSSFGRGPSHSPGSGPGRPSPQHAPAPQRSGSATRRQSSSSMGGGGGGGSVTSVPSLAANLSSRRAWHKEAPPDEWLVQKKERAEVERRKRETQLASDLKYLQQIRNRSVEVQQTHEAVLAQAEESVRAARNAKASSEAQHRWLQYQDMVAEGAKRHYESLMGAQGSLAGAGPNGATSPAYRGF